MSMPDRLGSSHEVQKLADKRKELEIRREERIEMERRVQARLRWHRFMKATDPLYEFREQLLKDPVHEAYTELMRSMYPDDRRARWKQDDEHNPYIVRAYRRYHAALKQLKRQRRWKCHHRAGPLHARTQVYLDGTPGEMAYGLVSLRFGIPRDSLVKHLRGKLS